MYRTELATQDELENWNQIVSRCLYSEALHSMEWRKALETSFRQMKPLYFVVRDSQDSLVGALPCFIFQPIPLSKTMLSMPWTLPGGLLSLVSNDVEEISQSAFQHLDKIAQKMGVSESTFTLPANCDKTIINSLESSGYVNQEERFTHILGIGEGFEAVWNGYNKRIRGAVRKSEKNSIIVRITTEEEDMVQFYKMYLAMMDKFGSTPKPYSLLRYLQISPIAKLVIAKLDNSLIGGLLFLHFNSYVRLWVETSDPEFLNYRTNNAMINYIVEWSCEKGYRFVDFGASPPGNDGLVAFKEEWGAKKEWFSIFTKVYSPWRKKLWAISEPSIRRIYAAIQHIKL